nr:hypothetical protein 42 [bacterium]
MSKRDLITGKWTARLRKRGKTQEITTCLYPKGYKPACETERTNSILGDIENIRYSRRGYMKGDLYEGRQMIAEITFHPKYIDYVESRGISYLDGRFRIDTSDDEMLMFDDDIRKKWIAKAEYMIDL